MRNTLKVGLLAVVAVFAVSAVAYAASAPWTPGPGASYSNGVVTLDNSNPAVTPAGSSYENSNLDVPVANGDEISFEYRSGDVACGGGVPRVFIQGGAYNTWDDDPAQCDDHVAVGDGWFRVTQDVEGITDGTAGHTGLVNDQISDRGVIEYRNLTIGGQAVALAPAPANADECKKGGWEAGGFKNQGECVSSFAKPKRGK